jgi:hypothetical protein
MQRVAGFDGLRNATDVGIEVVDNMCGSFFICGGI